MTTINILLQNGIPFGLVPLIVVLSFFCTLAVIYIPITIVSNKYKKFVLDHSHAIKHLNIINLKYTFETIPSLDLTHSYDNEHFFTNISPSDYLTYQLLYNSKYVQQILQETEINKRVYSSYLNDIKQQCILGVFDTNELPKNRNKLLSYEQIWLAKAMQKPTIELTIAVTLWQTTLNGHRISAKQEIFDEETIKSIILKLSQKSGKRYLDHEIWQALCRVERGRVTNKVRFAIYRRDNYRCRKCGKQTNDLEVDHIFPISKGGKSNFENLQTLCHRCNALKSNTIEQGTTNPLLRQQATSEVCPNCGIPLILRNGQYGKFYGCVNYPKCTFKKRL